MKNYTPEEKEEARKKLPEPILGFLGSQALTTIYLGIRDKLKLNLRQLMIVSEITNVTLTGLEPEHALETNLHQYMPELSNTDMRELVSDLNDRVFKEAQRRIRENVVEPREKLDIRVTPDGEPFLGEEVKIVPSVNQEAGASEVVPQKIEMARVAEKNPDGSEKAAMLPSVLAERLSAPAAVKTERKDVSPQATGIQRVSVPTPPAPLTTPPPPSTPVIQPSVAAVSTPEEAKPAAAASSGDAGPTSTVGSGVAKQAPRIYKGTDPYREPIE